MPLASSRNNPGVFHHDNHGSLAGWGAVQDSLRNDKRLPRSQFDRPTFEIDQQLPLHNIEEFVVVVFVSVIFTLHDAEAGIALN